MVLRIKELREAAGLSQVQLADRMGVAQSEEVLSVDYPILERIGNHYPEQGR